MARTSLTEKLIIYFILLSMGAIAIVGIYSYLSARKALMERTYNQLSTVRYLKKIEIEQFYRNRVHELELIASDPILSREFNSSESVYGFKPAFSLFPILASKPYYNRIIFSSKGNSSCIDLDSTEKISSEEFIQPNYEEFIKTVIKKEKTVISDLLPGKNGGWVQYLTKAVSYQGSDTLVIALELDSHAIDQLMPDTTPLNGLGNSGEAYLIGPDRLLRSNSRFIPDAVLRVPIDTSTFHIAYNGQDGTWLMKDYRGIQVLGSFSKLAPPSPNWVVIAEIDLKEAMVPIYATRNNVIFITVFIACIVFAATWLLSRKITRPLIELQKAAFQLGKGELGTRVEISSNDEIGNLAETFNTMSNQLEEKDKLLNQERIRRMKAAFDGQDVERQRLSRELHDGLGQSLIAQKLRMESIKIPKDKETEKAMEELKGCADQLVDEVRRISNALMPAQLHQFGLIAAIRQHCEEVTKYSKIEIEFDATGTFEPISRKSKTYLFRIIQEAINNLVKHSGATRANVELAHTRENIFLSIADNGKGFDMSNICFGNGLHNMKERTALLNGELSINSQPGNGTVVEIQIPFKA